MKQPSKDQQPAQKQPNDGEQIDWGNVASEVGIMLKLNPAAADQAEDEEEKDS